MSEISHRSPSEYHALEVENSKLHHTIQTQVDEIKRLNGIITELQAIINWNRKADELDDE